MISIDGDKHFCDFRELYWLQMAFTQLFRRILSPSMLSHYLLDCSTLKSDNIIQSGLALNRASDF